MVLIDLFFNEPNGNIAHACLLAGMRDKFSALSMVSDVVYDVDYDDEYDDTYDDNAMGEREPGKR